MVDNKFIVIDGNSLIHRAFWAIPQLTTGEGEFTNAVYGFTNMLLRMIEEEKPHYLAVAFDKGRPTHRVEAFAAYKGHRKATPDELRPQFELAKLMLAALRIPVFEEQGWEADDLIGTLSAQAEAEGLNCLVVTGDKDALQLISPRVHVMLTRKGISEVDRCDEEWVEAKYGLTPLQVIDLKGLMGDSSDNIPGIPGVGEKTALKLLHEYHSVEGVLANEDKISGVKLREKIATNKELALLSKSLATIVREVPLEVDWEDIRLEEPDWSAMLELCHRLEFKALAKKAAAGLERKLGTSSEEGFLLEGEKQVAEQGGLQVAEQEGLQMAEQGGLQVAEQEVAFEEPLIYTVLKISDVEEWQQALTDVTASDTVAIGFNASQANHQKGSLKDLILSPRPGTAYYVDLEEGQPPREQVLQDLATWWSDPGKAKLCHNGKALYWLLHNEGYTLKGLAFDTNVAAYLVNPARENHKFEQLVADYTKEEYPEGEDYPDFAGRTHLLWHLHHVLTAKLEQAGMTSLFTQVEMPLVEVLAKMEIEGISVDRGMLVEMSRQLGEAIDRLTGEIYTLSGEEFNINSPKQLAVILFEKLGLPVIKKTKTGYSTNAEVLAELAGQHEVVEKILEYRQLVKLKSTYTDGLAGLIEPETGTIHTTFNQTITATGRLSSTEPNLQNIPIRLELGRKIRKVFTPKVPGNLLLAADYSQIELRILAHISGDSNLKEAFVQGQDIHTRTASEVFGVPMEQVTPELRSRAKAVNFGIVYGLSDYGLSQDIKVSRKEAKQYIDSYFDRYPGVRAYIKRVIQEARDFGYVSTLLNRRRYLPDVNSSNRNVRMFGERTAMNTPIQGTAADIIKVAMVKLDQLLAESGLKSRMLLQVHDELILEVPPEELEQVSRLLKENMEQAMTLEVPLVVDLKLGTNWYEMKKL